VSDRHLAPSRLSARVREVLAVARSTYAGHPTAEPALEELQQRLAEPLRVAIAGRVKSGKSTLLNALVGQPLAATDAGECTRLVTWYRHGPTYRAFVQPRGGELEPAVLEREAGATAVDLGHHRVEDVDRLVVEWPASALASMTLIDTPGLGSLTTEVSERSEDLLGPADGTSPADAVLYLARHLHGQDVRFLEAFQDHDAGRPTPVNAVAVLARADEVGGGRLGAMAVARRVAGRYRTDHQLRRLCQTVVPVAGLLAEGASLLTEAEFRALGRLAEADDDAADDVLLSVDRFARRPARLDLADEEREHLLAQLGLFGVRTARDLLRRDEAHSANELATALRAHSGLDDLREVLATQFAARADLLKARAVLAALDHLLRSTPPDDRGALASSVERVEADAHELAELRLLLAVRRGGIALGEEEQVEVDRLVARSGLPARQRLDLDPAAEAGAVTAAVADAVERWRRRAEQPLAEPGLVAAAQVVVRSYEGMLAEA
jgi:hypothetical protein